MAGSGYKTFVAGQALTAAQVQGYLQDQAVQVYASTAARSSALGTAVAEGMVSYRTDENALEFYTGSAWETVRQPQVAGKNAIINGAFDIWQRGTSVAFASNATGYSADRWFITAANAAFTISQQAASNTGFQYALRFQRNSGQTGTGSPSLTQSFESVNSIPLAGQTVTLSFYARAGANYSAASSLLTAQIRSGTGTDQNIGLVAITGDATVAASNVTLTTSWQRFTITGTVGSTATQLFARFAFTTVGTAGAADYFEVTGVQLEAGSVATPFSRNASSIQGELAACQRYYWRMSANATNSNSNFGIGYANSTTVAILHVKTPVTMRITPTSLESSSINFQNYSASQYTLSNLSMNTAVNGADMIEVEASSTGMTAGHVGRWIASASTGYIGFSAEL